MIPFAFAMLLTTAPLVMPSSKEKTSPAAETPPSLLKSTASQSYFSIPLKERALDLQQAFDILKREKTTGKVYFQLLDQTEISNIIDMTLLPNSSLMLLRYNTNTQGIRIQVVKVEDIAGISYY